MIVARQQFACAPRSKARARDPKCSGSSERMSVHAAELAVAAERAQRIPLYYPVALWGRAEPGVSLPRGQGVGCKCLTIWG